MNRFSKNAIGIIAALTFEGSCGVALAQVPPPPEPGKADADTAISTRQELSARAKQNVGASDKSANLQPVIAFVRSTWRKMERASSVDAATATLIEDLDIDAVAVALTTLGYTNPDLRKASGSRQDLILAAQKVVLSRPSLEDMLILSPEVIVGDLLEVTFDGSLNDGFGSTAKLRVDRSIKGGIPVGDIISVRQRSGSASGDSINADDFAPSMTGKYVMFLSKSAYGVRARSKANPSSVWFSRILLPYRVDGSSLITTGLGQEDGKTLQDLTIPQ